MTVGEPGSALDEAVVVVTAYVAHGCPAVQQGVCRNVERQGQHRPDRPGVSGFDSCEFPRPLLQTNLTAEECNRRLSGCQPQPALVGQAVGGNDLQIGNGPS